MLQIDDSTNPFLSEEQVLEVSLSPCLTDAIRQIRNYVLISESCFGDQVSAQHDAVLIISGLRVREANGLDILIPFTAPPPHSSGVLHFLSDQALLRQHSLTSCDFKTFEEFLFACLSYLPQP